MVVWYYRDYCPTCGEEGELAICKKPSGQLCFRCAECLLTFDNPADLQFRERAYSGLHVPVTAPSRDEIERYGWGEYCVHEMVDDEIKSEWVLSIRFLERFTRVPHIAEQPRPAARGEIIIGGYRGEFCSPLDVWRCEEYELQWREARQRLTEGASTSCFVIGVHPPGIAAFIETYAAWRCDDEYRFQQKRLLLKEAGDIDPRRPYEALGEYKMVTADGRRIWNDWGIDRVVFSRGG